MVTLYAHGEALPDKQMRMTFRHDSVSFVDSFFETFKMNSGGCIKVGSAQQ